MSTPISANCFWRYKRDAVERLLGLDEEARESQTARHAPGLRLAVHRQPRGFESQPRGLRVVRVLALRFGMRPMERPDRAVGHASAAVHRLGDDRLAVDRLAQRLPDFFRVQKRIADVEDERVVVRPQESIDLHARFRLDEFNGIAADVLQDVDVAAHHRRPCAAQRVVRLDFERVDLRTASIVLVEGNELSGGFQRGDPERARSRAPADPCL